MAFLDKLGKSLNSAGQSVAKQTKTFADTTQYNASIAEKKRQITKIYTELGESYYMNHRDDTAAEEQERIDRINALNQEIEGLEGKIREAKGYVKCPGCGADVAPGMTFCNVCGTRVIPEAPAPAPAPANKICPSCGASVPEGSVFCTNCGTRLDAQEEPAPAMKPAGRVCRSCGAKLEEGSLFCTNCGTRVEEPAAEEAAGAAPEAAENAAPDPQE